MARTAGHGELIIEVQDLLGHASLATQIYVHAHAARLESAMMALSDVLDVTV
jgi:site-specific recombinase XerD